jgi:nucleotide-binding universal stress UspA family protein
MPRTFYNILVPVDFTGKNKWAVAKAIELANNFKCNIHLVHVVEHPLQVLLPSAAAAMLPYDNSAASTNAARKLEKLKEHYQQHLSSGHIEISVLEGKHSNELAAYIEEYEMDLVVIGLSKFNLLQRIWSSVSISRLARKTYIPVLAVRSTGLVSHFKKIVLPLDNEVPVHRIKLATLLARSFKSTIYLVGLRKEENVAEQILNRALEVIQSISTIPVQSFMLEGKNLAKSTLDFSKKINADLILAHPFKEFHMPGWWNRITRKLISYGSRIPVLTVGNKPEQASL